jgi:K+-transporting ATPase ATPase C chain
MGIFGSRVLDAFMDDRRLMDLGKLYRPAATLFLIFAALLGIVYPILITAVSQVAFIIQANGSVIYRNGEGVGSSLIGQDFHSAKYFWSRPSETSSSPYSPFDPAKLTGSSGSNLGPLSKTLITEIQARVDYLHTLLPLNKDPIPVDLVTSSGSGLDPHISPAAAYYQIPRVALARGMSETDLTKIVEAHAENKFLGFLGLSYVNVLGLNLALDDIQ